MITKVNNSKLQKKQFAQSVQGKRLQNEDRFTEVQKPLQTLTNLSVTCVFDGHGGAEAAEFASKELHKILFEYLDQGVSAAQALRQSFNDVNTQLHSSGTQAGTTATVALINGPILYLAHVGDSRAVLIREGELTALTKDHVLTDRGELERYHASTWYREKSGGISRGNLKGFKLIAISRSLGDAYFEDAVSAEPDIKELELKEGDILIIATDGLWNFVSNEEVLETIQATSPFSDIPKALIDKALVNKSSDNVTVELINVASQFV